MKARNYVLSGGMALLMAVLPSVVHASSTDPNVYVVPGVPTGGFPNFDFSSVSIKLAKSGSDYKLTAIYTPTGASDSISFQTPNQTYDIYHPGFSLTAYFTAYDATTQQFTFDVSQANNFIITGYLPTCTEGCSDSTLFSGDLQSAGADTQVDSSPVSLGFTINNFAGWATQFAPSTPGNESIYLYNFPVGSLTNSFNSAAFIHNSWTGSAVTTVPVPAAAWLFGSALAAFSVVGRKKLSSKT